MNELNQYNVYKEKLQGICDENNLTFSINNKCYPFSMMVKPCSGIDAQMSMLEDEDTGDTGYISPEAIIVFAYKDGELTYKMAETINISDTLFNKIKNLFKKLHNCWMQYFFRDRTEGMDRACNDDTCEDTEPVASEDAPCTADGAENTDDFADFFGDPEDADEDDSDQ